jgi:hypothetical protein
MQYAYTALIVSLYFSATILAGIKLNFMGTINTKRRCA